MIFSQSVTEVSRAMMSAFAISAVSAPFVFRLLVKAKSRQTISQHIQEHAHKQGTPTMGGLIVLVGILASLALFWTPEFAGLAFMLCAFSVVGFLDDYLIPRLKPGSRGFEWLPKLALQSAVSAIALALSGERTFPGFAFGIIFILFFCNAYNFADGLDGLAGGLGMLIAGGTLLIAWTFGVSNPLVNVSCASMIGAFVPFLFLNAPPARVFMGDIGSLPIGGAFALVWLRLLHLVDGTRQPNLCLSLAIVGVVMLLEIVPVPIQIASVKLLGRRAFPFKTPIHHGLQASGWPETRIVYAFHLVQVLVIGAALALAGASG